MADELVLIAEDDQEIGRLLSINLTLEGFETRHALNGIEALELLEKERPRLALLDIMMPGIDGIEVCRRIRDDPQNDIVVIVILSAKDDPSTMKNAFEAGASEFVSKPLDIPQFCKDIRKRLRDGPG
jgi:DNA-binding response OmpR family regulator